MELEQSFAAATAARHPDGTAAVLLSRLRDAHAVLTDAMAALDRLTCEPLDPIAVPGARWRLSAANRARREVWQDCYHHLLPLVDQATAIALTKLKSRDIAMARFSADHVARWPSHAVKRDWEAYCEASRAVRARMSAAIEVEQRLVYPILTLHRAGPRSLARSD